MRVIVPSEMSEEDQWDANGSYVSVGEIETRDERIRTLDEILDELTVVAQNFDKGWTATPPTMAALIRSIIRELKATKS